MTKFNVTIGITETVTKVIVIEAEDAADAIRIAYAQGHFPVSATPA